MHSEGSGKGGNTFGLDVRFPVFCFSVSSVLSHMAFPTSLLSLSLSQLVTLRPLRPHHHHLAIVTTLSHSHTQHPPRIVTQPVLSFSILLFTASGPILFFSFCSAFGFGFGLTSLRVGFSTRSAGRQEMAGIAWVDKNSGGVGE